MQGLAEHIAETLESYGINVIPCQECHKGFSMLKATGLDGHSISIIPVETECKTQEEAVSQSASIILLKSETEGPVITIPRDRWERQNIQTVKRLLAHCGIYTQVFARNCEVRRIEKWEAQEFMSESHSYGGASCRYCYGLYVKRYSGKEMESGVHALPVGTLVAAAEFSNARKWTKGNKEIRSYEWIRYASLTGTRVSGGMGKALRQFIREISPDDIMSYADMEWSDGTAYRQLGFKEDGIKSPVLFTIDPQTWTRTPFRQERMSDGTAGICEAQEDKSAHTIWYRNQGSIKYRLKLTEW